MSSQIYWQLKPADALTGVVLPVDVYCALLPVLAGSSFISHIFTCLPSSLFKHLVSLFGAWEVPTLQMKFPAEKNGSYLHQSSHSVKVLVQINAVAVSGRLMVKALSAAADMQNRGRSFCKVTAPHIEKFSMLSF